MSLFIAGLAFGLLFSIPFWMSSRLPEDIVVPARDKMSNRAKEIFDAQDRRESIIFHIGMLNGMAGNDDIPEEYRDHLKQASEEMKAMFENLSGEGVL